MPALQLPPGTWFCRTGKRAQLFPEDLQVELVQMPLALEFFTRKVSCLLGASHTI